MRILHIVGSLKLPHNPEVDGASGAVRVALEIARAQVRLGHETWVAAVDQESSEMDWQGVRLVRLKIAPWARARLGNFAADFRVQFPLMAFTRRYRFDVLQGYLHHYLRFLRARIRIVSFHVDPLYKGQGEQDLSMKASDFAVIARTSNVQLAASRFVGGQLQQGLDGNGNIHVVHNGVDNERFDPDRWTADRQRLRQMWGVSDGAVVFLYAGAIVPEKGVLHLAKAFARSNAGMPESHLALAGAAALWDQSLEEHNPEREYEDEVRKTLAPATREGKVRFLGSLGVSDMPRVYAASDVVVVPSVWQEAFGLVALEGLASGRPVIASNTGGLPEFVNATNGVLVPPGDENSLQTAMCDLARDPELRRRLALNGRSQALRFSWEEIALKLEAVYAGCLAGMRSS